MANSQTASQNEVFRIPESYLVRSTFHQQPRIYDSLADAQSAQHHFSVELETVKLPGVSVIEENGCLVCVPVS